MSRTRFSIEAIFKGIDKFSAPVARMVTGMDRFTRKVRKGMTGIGKATKRMARGFRNSALTLGSLAVMGGFAFRGLMGPAIRFEHAMDGINAVVLGAYKEHMPKLRKAALKLGTETTFTATQVANAMEVLAKSGLKAHETLSLIRPTLKGAEAAGSDINTMADILVSTIAQMADLTPADGTDVIDAYAVAASSANTTLEELGEGMKKVIPIGETLNFKFRDLLATTTLLQHMGIEASMSAAQQRTFFTRLASLTPKAAKSFKGMGIDILKDDKSGDVKALPNLLAAIAKGFAKIKGNKGAISKMAEAVGLRGGIAGNILIRNMDQLEALLLKIDTLAEGAAEKMAGMRLENTHGDLVRLKSAWDTFRIKIASGQLPELSLIFEGLTDMLNNPVNVEKWAGHLNDAVRNMKAWWAENRMIVETLTGSATGGLKTVFKGIWAALILIDAALRIILFPFMKLWDLASALTPEADWVDNFNAWMGGFHPSMNEPQTYGAPYRKELYGEIIVRAEPGTTARIANPRSKEGIPIMLMPNGDFEEWEWRGGEPQ